MPVPDENGPAYADFTFQVRDDGGTADGGVDLDSVPNTITIDVVSVNDAPEGTDTTLTTNEDVPYTFSAADFGYSDQMIHRLITLIMLLLQRFLLMAYSSFQVLPSRLDKLLR
ncbi:MAG: hypothetical protein R3D88_06510 [Alphaproteobacteria bacterium]